MLLGFTGFYWVFEDVQNVEKWIWVHRRLVTGQKEAAVIGPVHEGVRRVAVLKGATHQ